MNKKVMISQPMNGLTDEQILETKKKATKYLENSGYEVINTFFQGKEEETANSKHNVPLAYLALSFLKMAECDAVYFCKGWNKTRGCVMEHEAAEKYGLEILYEE